MLTEKMANALNLQINRELFSAYLYLSMSSYAAHEGYKGAANWFMVQTQEELSHARMLYRYLLSQGQRVVMEAIDKPEAEFNTYQELFTKALEHEQFITRCFNELTEIARGEKDHATEIFLQWFVTEQVEEEENLNTILGELKMAGGQGLFMIDRELTRRTFTPPPQGE